jgi:putative Ca2+/H+ antiporter (TMEM165/GDT1 family)
MSLEAQLLPALAGAAMAAGLTVLLQWLLQPVAHRLDLLDYPTERKDHAHPTPITGGLAMAVAALATSVMLTTRLSPSFLGFAIGAVLLIRESLEPDDDDVELAEHRESRPFWRIVLTCFGVLFAAEWGDASQIATAGLVARKDGLQHAVATGVGAFAALVAVAALATVIGKVLVRRLRLHLVHRVAGVLFAGFALIALVAAIRG